MEHVSELREALPDQRKLKNHINGMGDQADVCEMSHSQPQLVHVEVCQAPYSATRKSIIKEHVLQLLQSHPVFYGDLTITEFKDPFLTENVTSVSVTDTEFLHLHNQMIDLSEHNLQISIFQLHEDGPAAEELEGDEELAAANHWLLPSKDFSGLWENLVFDRDIKAQLLQYARTTLLFSDKCVDSNVISWNRVILLHGPPGTGKTSLCKALAQKLSILMSDRYSYGQLIEINSHSLFSKWFSESGKLVMKMFQKIQELVDDQEALIFVLIDEVESLTAARKSAMAGTEPSDAIRVVNALLTQIDQIKKNPNVVILTTSNITGAIDLAFVDRADIKQFIGLPSPAAIYRIYHSCLCELMRTGIISPSESLFDLKTLEMMRFTENTATRLSLRLKEISASSQGLSGRVLRKIPFLAHAVYIQSSTTNLETFLNALAMAVQRQFDERSELSNS